MSPVYIARATEVAARSLDGEMMIMSARDSTLFTLNPVGTLIWQSADGNTPLAEIVERKICAEFAVDPDGGLQGRRGLCERSGRPRHPGCVPGTNHSHKDGPGRRAMSLMQELGQRALDRGVPLSVQLDVTYRCNERCVHCYLDHDDHGEMTTAEIRGLLDQLAEAGVFFLTLSGGEVFMRMDFFDIVEYARSLMFCVKIKTNAFMIREKEAQRLRDLAVQDVQVSIYSHRPEVHDAITLLPGSLQRTIAGIRLLRSHGVKVIIANVLMMQNLGDHAGVKELAKELGAEYTIDPTITPMMDGDRSVLRLGLGVPQLQSVFRNSDLVGDVDEFCAPPPAVADDVLDRTPMQRRPHRVLHLALWRSVSLRAVSFAQRQCAPAEVLDIWHHSAPAQRGALHHRCAICRFVPDAIHVWHVHALSRTGLPGRKHARPVLVRTAKSPSPGRGSRRPICI